MGSVNSAMAPNSTIRIDSTDAKIGRRMKKCENFTVGSPGLRLRLGFWLWQRAARSRLHALSFGLRTSDFGLRTFPCGLCFLHLDLRAGPQHHQAVDDDPFLRRQPLDYLAQRPVRPANGDVAPLNLVLLVGDIDKPIALVRLDGHVRDN